MVLTKKYKNKIKKGGVFSKKSKDNYKHALDQLAEQNIKKQKEIEISQEKLIKDKERLELEKAEELIKKKQKEIDEKKRIEKKIQKQERDFERKKDSHKKKINDALQEISCDLYEYDRSLFDIEKAKNQFEKLKIQEFATFLKNRINQNINTYTIIYEGSDEIDPETGSSQRIDFKFLYETWWKNSIDRLKYKEWGYNHLRGPNGTTDWLRSYEDILIKEKKQKDENEFKDRLYKKDYESATQEEKIKLDEIDKFIDDKEKNDSCLPYKVKISDEELENSLKTLENNDSKYKVTLSEEELDKQIEELDNFELLNNLEDQEIALNLSRQEIGGNLSKKNKKKKKWSKKYKRSINCKKPKGFSQKQYCKAKHSKKVKK